MAEAKDEVEYVSWYPSPCESTKSFVNRGTLLKMFMMADLLASQLLPSWPLIIRRSFGSMYCMYRVEHPWPTESSCRGILDSSPQHGNIQLGQPYYPKLGEGQLDMTQLEIDYPFHLCESMMSCCRCHLTTLIY